jgi:CheY-like chemotaxis protein
LQRQSAGVNDSQQMTAGLLSSQSGIDPGIRTADLYRRKTLLNRRVRCSSSNDEACSVLPEDFLYLSGMRWLIIPGDFSRSQRYGLFLEHSAIGVAGMAADRVPSEILLVEDDEATRLAYLRLLETHGYRVAAFDGIGGALDLAKTGFGHLLLTDVRLKAGEPHGVTLALMIHLSRPELPIILVTAYPELQGLIDTQLGPILLKPVDPDTMLAAIKRALER